MPENKEVSYAKFKQPLWIPTLGVVGESLPSPHKTFKVKMYLKDTYLWLKTTGPVSEFAVPLDNIVCVEFAKSSE